ncbi:MAG: signal peptidase I [Bdellovibrionota bacterium]
MKKRKPWISLVLTLVCPGLGQLYNGNIPWAAAAFVLGTLLSTVSVVYLFDSFAKLIWALCLGLAFDLVFAVQAWIESRRLGEVQLKPYQRWWNYIGFALVLYGIPDGYGLFMPSRFLSFQIPSESMVPTLLVGDRLVADGWSFWHQAPARGEVVVFDYPKDPTIKYVKRIVGIPGDTIEVKDGELYLNGKIVEQERSGRTVDPVGGWQPVEFMENLGGVRHIVYRTQPMLVEKYGPMKVPPDNYFMMGDNRDRSNDSRFWGFVRRDQIVGRMAYVYFSWDSESSKLRTDRLGLQIH